MDNSANSETTIPKQINMNGINMSYESFSNILKMFRQQFKDLFKDFKKNANDLGITEFSNLYKKESDKYIIPIKIYDEYIQKEGEDQNTYETRIKGLLPLEITNRMRDYIVYLNNLIESQCSNLCSDKGYGDLCRRRCLTINNFIDNFKRVLNLKQGTSCEPTYANTMRITSYSTTYLISQVFLSDKEYFYSSDTRYYTRNSRCDEAIKVIRKNLNNGDIYFLDKYINKVIELAKKYRKFRKLYNLLFFKQNPRQIAGKYKDKQLKRNRTLKKN